MDPRSAQKPMTAHARRSGYEALRAVLRAERPGFDVVFVPKGEAAPPPHQEPKKDSR